MELFPIREDVNIVIPEIVITDNKISKKIYCKRIFVPKKEIFVDIYDSDYFGWYELRTKNNLPFNKLFLRKAGTKRAVNDIDCLCLESKEKYKIENINEKLKFAWIKETFKLQQLSPEKIVDSWNNKFYFIEETEFNNGLRKPQLGALHSIAAYFSLEKNTDAATIVLPTGTGKTEVMLSTLVYMKLKKVLIIVPSTALREQTVNKFCSLGCLIDIGVLSKDILLPYVSVLRGGINSIDEAESLIKESNVIISTVDSLNSSDGKVLDFLCKNIETLFVDEAHHISAKTWSAIKEKFKGKKILQFTATPFRNDNKNLDGNIIYNYTVGEAQKAGYFKHINLIAIEEYFPDCVDEKIAKKAIEQLKKDLDSNFNHIVMARVNSIEHAEKLVKIYKQLASEYQPILVHSGLGKLQTDKYIESLKNGHSKIVVCVNMLGEGFDLPNLKIAALHDVHKSLAITLQFVGRFIRSKLKSNIGEASVIVNVADPYVAEELQDLYSHEAEWDAVLSRLSENRIEEELTLQNVIQELKEKGSLHKYISLWNLRPSFSAMLFKAEAEDWQPELYKKILPKNTTSWYSYSDREKLMVVLAIQKSPVIWGNYRDFCDSIYQVLIMKFDDTRKAVFVYSNDYDFFRTEILVENVCSNKCQLVSGRKIFNIFSKINHPLVKNLGTSQTGAISFTQYFGPNVTEGLDKIQEESSNLMNLACIGYEYGNRILIGCSQKKGKIWSHSGGKITDWINWVQKYWDRIQEGNINDNTSDNDITKNFLSPEKINCNHTEKAYSISWGEYIQSTLEEKIFIVFDSINIPLYLVDINIEDCTKNNKGYNIIISSGQKKSIYNFSINTIDVNGEISSNFKYSYVSGSKLKIKKFRNTFDLEEYFKKDPPIIHYVDGSYSYNYFLIRTNDNIGKFNLDGIKVIDWSGINIRKESMGYQKDRTSIQWRIYSDVIENDKFDILINDDDSGEIADLIGIKTIEDEIRLTFIHCKYSSENFAGARIKDIDVVCGQAQKSVNWKHIGMKYIVEHIKKRENVWKNKNQTRFLKGSIRELEIIKRKSYTYKLKLNVIIVQPGLKKSIVSDDILRLLECTAVYLKKTTNADLEVICSD